MQPLFATVVLTGHTWQEEVAKFQTVPAARAKSYLFGTGSKSGIEAVYPEGKGRNINHREGLKLLEKQRVRLRD